MQSHRGLTLGIGAGHLCCPAALYTTVFLTRKPQTNKLGSDAQKAFHLALEEPLTLSDAAGHLLLLMRDIKQATRSQKKLLRVSILAKAEGRSGGPSCKRKNPDHVTEF